MSYRYLKVLKECNCVRHINVPFTLEWYAWAQIRIMQIALCLSCVHFLQTRIYRDMLYIETEIGLHSRQLKENSEFELKSWRDHEKSSLRHQGMVQKGIWRAKQTRANEKIRKDHLRKISVPVHLCCGCRSLIDRHLGSLETETYIVFHYLCIQKSCIIFPDH